MGAGVQGFEISEAADNQGLLVVSGACDTVGVAGGFTQGGGHSPAASRFGLSADQALEWEVIDGCGRFHTASRTLNTDLFWALSGGGGGSYGVVWSLTVKAHADIPTSGAYLNFTSATTTQDAFWKAVEAYHANLPILVDNGIETFYFVSSATFEVAITGPGVSAERLKTLLIPSPTNYIIETSRPFPPSTTTQDIMQCSMLFGALCKLKPRQKPRRSEVT